MDMASDRSCSILLDGPGSRFACQSIDIGTVEDEDKDTISRNECRRDYVRSEPRSELQMTCKIALRDQIADVYCISTC